MQVLLFSFAVLEPLHYLTEIAWLRKKSFYLKDSRVPSRGYMVAAVVAVALSLASGLLKHDLWFWTVGAMLLISLTALVRNPLQSSPGSRSRCSAELTESSWLSSASGIRAWMISSTRPSVEYSERVFIFGLSV